MNKISNKQLHKIISEMINETIVKKGGNIDHFTPYSQKEKEANFKAIGRVGNPSYNAFKKWRDEGLAQGKPSIELSWANYQKMLHGE